MHPLTTVVVVSGGRDPQHAANPSAATTNTDITIRFFFNSIEFFFSEMVQLLHEERFFFLGPRAVVGEFSGVDDENVFSRSPVRVGRFEVVSHSVEAKSKRPDDNAKANG